MSQDRYQRRVGGVASPPPLVLPRCARPSPLPPAACSWRYRSAALLLPNALAGAAGPSAASVLGSARAAIDAQPGVHVVFAGHSSSAAERIVADVGTTGGTETATDGKAELSVRVTPTAAYVSGTRSGLTMLFSFTTAQAKQVGTRWVYWKAGTSPYANLKADVTMPSVTALLPKAAGTRVSTANSGVAGAPVYVLRWTSPAAGTTPKLSNTLTVSARSPNLPVVAASTAPKGVKLTSTFSQWGEDVEVPVPPAALTIDSSKVKG